jgi:hypothetical protein
MAVGRTKAAPIVARAIRETTGECAANLASARAVVGSGAPPTPAASRNLSRGFRRMFCNILPRASTLFEQSWTGGFARLESAQGRVLWKEM